jgi:hypothetical protein
VALAAADVRGEAVALGLEAAGVDRDLAANKGEGADQARLKDHIGAGVGELNVRDGAVATQLGFPGERRRLIGQQATFFVVATAVIITVKILALFSGGSFHGFTWLLGSLSAWWQEARRPGRQSQGGWKRD